MLDHDTEDAQIPTPASVDLDGDPAWVHVCERAEGSATAGWMVALEVAQSYGECEFGQMHGVMACQNLSASEARKLAAALLNCADELDKITDQA